MGELTATGNGHLENTEVTSVRQESTRNAGQSIKVFIKSQKILTTKRKAVTLQWRTITELLKQRVSQHKS